MITVCLCTAFSLTAPLADNEDKLAVLGRTELRCPACRNDFTTVVCVQANTRCGVDRDLFARALGPQPEFYRISTCPHCGYSGYLSDFDHNEPLPSDVVDRILKQPRLALPPGFGPASDPRDLDPAVRYALAITCYEWRRKSPEALAWLHLRAAWVEREQGANLPPDDRLKRVLRHIERWRPALDPGQNQLDVEMQLASRTTEALAAGRFNRYQAPYVRLAVALILRRHGENIQAVTLLDSLPKTGSADLPDGLHESITAMRQSIVRESQLQRKAADAFEQAVMANQIDPANLAPAKYLLGELCRRLGQEADAVRWFDGAIGDSTLPPSLRQWASEQQNACLTFLQQ